MPAGGAAIASVVSKRERKREKEKQDKEKAINFENDQRAIERATGLSDKQIEEYREMFNLYDTDKSGTISVTEMQKVMRNAGMDIGPEAANEIFQEMDIDSNGTIEFQEFLTVMSRVLENEDTEEDLITIFRILDQDGDGFITKSDLRECCIRVGSHLTPQDLDEMLNEADKDGDGQITYEEFLKILEARS